MPDKPVETSSPACLAHEAGDVYMGYATLAEIAAFLKDLDAGRVTPDALRKMLPRIRDDALHRELSERLARSEAGGKIG